MRVKTYRATTKTCRTCNRQRRVTKFYANAAGQTYPDCSECQIAKRTGIRRATRTAVEQTREHGTLRLVNPSLSAYRERWRYCVGGWILLQESPSESQAYR